jgi:hypothetical protein
MRFPSKSYRLRFAVVSFLLRKPFILAQDNILPFPTFRMIIRCSAHTDYHISLLYCILEGLRRDGFASCERDLDTAQHPENRFKAIPRTAFIKGSLTCAFLSAIIHILSTAAVLFMQMIQNLA